MMTLTAAAMTLLSTQCTWFALQEGSFLLANSSMRTYMHLFETFFLKWRLPTFESVNVIFLEQAVQLNTVNIFFLQGIML